MKQFSWKYFKSNLLEWYGKGVTQNDVDDAVSHNLMNDEMARNDGRVDGEKTHQVLKIMEAKEEILSDDWKIGEEFSNDIINYFCPAVAELKMEPERNFDGPKLIESQIAVYEAELIKKTVEIRTLVDKIDEKVDKEFDMQMALDVVAGDALKIEEKIAVDFVEKEEMIVENGAQKVEPNLFEKPQNSWIFPFDEEILVENFGMTKPLFDDSGGVENFLFDLETEKPLKKTIIDDFMQNEAFEKWGKILEDTFDVGNRREDGGILCDGYALKLMAIDLDFRVRNPKKAEKSEGKWMNVVLDRKAGKDALCLLGDGMSEKFLPKCQRRKLTRKDLVSGRYGVKKKWPSGGRKSGRYPGQDGRDVGVKSLASLQ
jgi:hypothetical protein